MCVSAPDQLLSALKAGDEGSVKKLVSDGEVTGEYALIQATKESRWRIAASLIRSGISLTRKRHRIELLGCGKPQILAAVLESGWRLTASEVEEAIWADYDDAEMPLVLTLLDSDVSANNAMLAVCLEHGRYDLAERCLSGGADVNEVREGSTLLHLAAAGYSLHEDALTWLLSHGAEPNLRDEDDQTPLNIAQDEGSNAAAGLLREAGAKDHTPAEQSWDEPEDLFASVPFPGRRGAKTWEEAKYRCEMVDLDPNRIAEALSALPLVESVRELTPQEARGEIPRFYGPAIIACRFEGHPWTHLLTSGLSHVPSILAKQTGCRALSMRANFDDDWIYLRLQQGSKELERLSTDGSHFEGDWEEEDAEGDPFTPAEAMTSALRDAAQWTEAQQDAASAIHSLMQEHEAYSIVLNSSLWQPDQPLTLSAWDEDALDHLQGCWIARFDQPDHGTPDVSHHSFSSDIYYQKVDQVLAALRYGASPHLLDGSASTPLIRAAESVHRGPDAAKQMVEAILGGGADPGFGFSQTPISAVLDSFMTPEHQIAEMVRLLLAEGADPNGVAHYAEHQGESPLHGAARHGQAAAALVLLMQGGDPKAVNADARTPEDLAMQIIKRSGEFGHDSKGQKRVLEMLRLSPSDWDAQLQKRLEASERSARISRQKQNQEAAKFGRAMELLKEAQEADEDDHALLEDLADQAHELTKPSVLITPVADPEWVEPDIRDDAAAAFQELGYTPAGFFKARFDAFTEVVLEGFTHEEKGLDAVHYQSESAPRPWNDVVAHYVGEARLTLSNAPHDPGTVRAPGHQMIVKSKADIQALHDQVLERDRVRIGVTAEGFEDRLRESCEKELEAIHKSRALGE